MVLHFIALKPILAVIINKFCINSLDTELIDYWQTNNSWSDITVIRTGRARKYQALAVPNGSQNASDNNGAAWNAGAYTKGDSSSFKPPFYKYLRKKRLS